MRPRWPTLLLTLATVAVARPVAAQVTFNGSAFVCFQDAVFTCDPNPSTLNGFGGAWSRFTTGPGGDLDFNGYGINVTTDATTGLAAFTAGDALFTRGNFTGTFYLALLFTGAPTNTSPLVFSGAVSTQNNQLSINFNPSQQSGTYGAGASPYTGTMNNLVLTRGATTPSYLTGQLSVTPPTTTVPEPSSMLLLGSALVSLVAWRRLPSRARH